MQTITIIKITLKHGTAGNFNKIMRQFIVSKKLKNQHDDNIMGIST